MCNKSITLYRCIFPFKCYSMYIIIAYAYISYISFLINIRCSIIISSIHISSISKIYLFLVCPFCKGFALCRI
nr:MAG TPA: 24-sterol C-methyltransferase [Caudoviricetes sp.]